MTPNPAATLAQRLPAAEPNPVEDIFREAQAAAREAYRRPLSTYRLQFNNGFRFVDAKAIVRYLYDLGVDHVYASPYFEAQPGSQHGYDIVSHNRLNPEIGTDKEYRALVAEIQKFGMGQLFDMVPNHVGIANGNNPWWADVLENGPGAHHASYFDIYWDTGRLGASSKVLLPVLGDIYGKVLESGDIHVVYEDGGFALRYFSHHYPLDPKTTTTILDLIIEQAPPENVALSDLESIRTALKNLPDREETSPERVEERYRETEIAKRRLQTLADTMPAVRKAVDRALVILNGKAGDSPSFDRLDDLLSRQVYRLSYWRVAGEEINYRRFFDINELAGIRMENPAAFDEAHAFLFQLIDNGAVTGLRIDHPDGLWDPTRYFWKLQRGRFEQLARRIAGEQWAEYGDQVMHLFDRERTRFPRAAELHPLYVVAEKILSGNESLPNDWPVDGTTGYDFMNDLNGIFVDTRNSRAFDRLYQSFTNTRINFHDLINSTKKTIMEESIESAIQTLSVLLNNLSERNRWTRDFTLNTLQLALREMIAAMPVYRTYINPEVGTVSARDRAYIEEALAEARRRSPRTATNVYDFLRDVLLLNDMPNYNVDDRTDRAYFVRKLQQTEGLVMAKGVEDTAFYIYTRLLSLNEVGGEPDQFGISPSEFHRRNTRRLRRYPGAMLATSTHDTKRSEDARARLNVLSEMPSEWLAALRRWRSLNATKRVRVGRRPAPAPDDEYLIYQSLVAIWPLEGLTGGNRASILERLQGYVEKATREAKLRTSWVNPNQGYESALKQFLAAMFDDRTFLEDVAAFLAPVVRSGIINSLAQVAVKATAPGMPDFYRGTELFDFSLVDPDNRRPVDFDLRRRLLHELQHKADGDRPALLRSLLAEPADSRIKLFVTWQALQFRRKHRELMERGDYVPLLVAGARRWHVLAFSRQLDGEAALTVTPRLVHGLTGGEMPVGPDVWGDGLVILPDNQPRVFRNALTGEVVHAATHDAGTGLLLADVFAQFPLALLEPADT